jgi:hypothetical protein
VYVGSNGAGPSPQTPVSNKDGKKQSRITRYTMQTTTPYAILPETEKTIIEVGADGQNGAAVAFGHDGMLYVNTSTTASFKGFVQIDLDTNRDLGNYTVAYSNLTAPGAGGNALSKTGVVLDGPQPTQPTSIACLYIILQPMEVQILM